MNSLILSRRDLEFLLYEWLDAEALCGHPRHADHSRETFDAVLDLCEQIATEHFATHNRKNDLNEPTFDGETIRIIPEVRAALDIFAEAGLIAAGQDYELGGMQLPLLVEKAGFAWFLAANVGTAAYPFLTIGNANLLLTYGTREQIETWVRPMMEGRYFGTMCLSEPQAGSSLADVRTRAEPGMTAATACSATRCGFPVVITSSRRILCIWYWRVPRMRRRASGVFPCSWCRSGCRTPVNGMMSYWPV